MSKPDLYTVKALHYYKAIETQKYDNVGGFDNFMEIQVQKYNEFGMSDREKKILRLQKEKLLLESDLILNEDRKAITFINIKEKQIKKFKGDSDVKKSQFGSNCAMLRKWGFNFNSSEITLFDFLSNLELYKSQNAKQG